MKKILAGLFLFLAVTSSHAEWIPLPHGFIGFGDTDPFNGPGRVTVYDFNENIPKFEAWIVNLGDLFSKPDAQIKSFLIPIPESGVVFEQIDIDEVYVDDRELMTNMGHMWFIGDSNDLGLGKGFAFGNIAWQVALLSSVPEPAPWSLFLLSFVLMAVALGKRDKRVMGVAESRLPSSR